MPFERWREVGRVRSWWETTKLVALQPQRFFRTPSIATGAVTSMTYGLVSWMVNSLIFATLIIVFALIAGLVVTAQTGEPIGLAVGGIYAGYAVCSFVQAPMYALMEIVFGAVFSHMSLWLMKERGLKFDDTIRVVSYAEAVKPLWTPAMFIPCVGWLICIGWAAYIEMVGLREVHGVSTDKAAAAAFGYRVFFIGGLLLIYGLLIWFTVATAPPGRGM